MSQRILIIQGHPDPSERHFCHALEEAYAKGALESGREVKSIQISTLDFPLLRSQKEWQKSPLPEGLKESQQAIAWADHIVFIFPLWLGDMPALLKGFLEQVARPGFALLKEGDNPFGKKGLTGRSARVIVTMGMPSALYRWYFRAHSVKSMKRNILEFVGIAPVATSLIGSAGNIKPAKAQHWLTKIEALGRLAS